jgi:hypothetical protein
MICDWNIQYNNVVAIVHETCKKVKTDTCMHYFIGQITGNSCSPILDKMKFHHNGFIFVNNNILINNIH